MVRRDLVASKVTRASGWLDSAEATFAQSPATFVADVNGRDLALFYLFLAVQECIDIAAHGCTRCSTTSVYSERRGRACRS